MTVGDELPRADSIRRALRTAYGLALEGLSDLQVLAAAAPLGGLDPALAPSRILARVVDRLPIGESWMFRDEPLWRWLQEDVLPGLVVDALAAGRQLRAASLGCAGGQEAHSLAILLLGLLEAAAIPPIAASACARILGLDASPARVAVAASGEACESSVQRCPARWLAGRVRPVADGPGRWQVDEAVRRLCRFEVGNLLEVARPGSQALRGMELVLCRHVLGAFHRAEAAAVVAGLVRALDPGAVLILSPAEAHLATGLASLEPAGAAWAFRRLELPAARTVSPPAPLARARFRGRPLPLPVDPLQQDGPTAASARAALGQASAGGQDPGDLLSRLLVGRKLPGAGRSRPLPVQAELLELRGCHPSESAVPQPPGRPVGPPSAAAALLLERGDGR